MASIEIIKGSDGSGNAEIATVQNTRTSGASTIIVDTVTGINPAGFAGSMGTPHTFTDPITSEVITVISEATAVDFTGHVDGSNLEIDDIAPGYVDNGSIVGDIVIIKPTTQYADNLAEILEVAHDDDGSLKAGAVDAAAVLASNVVTTGKILNANVTADKLATGAVAATYAGGSTTSSLTYVNQLADTIVTSVTAIIGANGLALVTVSFNGYMTGNSTQSHISWAASGANTIAAQDKNAVIYGVGPSGGGSGLQMGASKTVLLTGLTPGSTVFTINYLVQGASTVTVNNSDISVVPL